MHLMNPAQRDRTAALIRKLADQLGATAERRDFADQLAAQVEAMSIRRVCSECSHFNNGYCGQWRADVPQTERHNGCDAWDEDIPF